MGSDVEFADYEAPGDLNGLEAQGIKGDWKENYPDYLGCCKSVDSNVGRIRDELEQQVFVISILK